MLHFGVCWWSLRLECIMSSSLLVRQLLLGMPLPHHLLSSSDLGIDTSFSDLWVVSDKSTHGCLSSQSAYPQASFQYSGTDMELLYGDSTSGAAVLGMIGKDTVTLAGISFCLPLLPLLFLPFLLLLFLPVPSPLFCCSLSCQRLLTVFLQPW